MELSVLERLLLLELLRGQSGDIVTLRVVTDALKAVGFTEPEHKILAFVNNDAGNVSWNPLDPQKIELGEKAGELIAAGLKKLSDAEKLTLEHVSLWDKFVGEEKAEDAA